MKKKINKLVVFSVLAACWGAFAGCGGSATQGGALERGQTSKGGKGDIYGEDNRLEYYQSPNSALKEVGRATAVLVDEDEINRGDSGSAKLPDATLREDNDMCKSARFSEQPAPGGCTAFLVAPDVMVSAGHCIDDRTECQNTEVVFGFQYDSSDDENVHRLEQKDVYQCKSVIHRDYSSSEDLDYGVFRLDRKVENRKPLDFRREGKPDEETPLAIVGHPMGLPLKIAAGGQIIDNTPENYILYNLDGFGGHSGAPVVNTETGKVEAIHVRGAPDYKWTEQEGESCRIARSCEEVDEDSHNCGGTEGTRAPKFAPHVPGDSSNETDSSCCRVCETGRACGDTCIASDAICNQPDGCACDAS